jgi:hypothetical protein
MACVYNGLKEDTQTSATMHGINMSWKDAATIQHYRGREMMSVVRNATPTVIWSSRLVRQKLVRLVRLSPYQLSSFSLMKV